MGRLNKIAISPVVAIALLLIVAVVAVIGYQNWFMTFQSGMFVDTETQSNDGIDGGLKIDSLVGNTLYVINNIKDDLIVKELKIGGNVCIVTDNLTLGMNEISVLECLAGVALINSEIVLVTENKIVSEKLLIDNYEFISSLSPDYDCVLTDYKNSTSCIDNSVVDGCGTGTVLDIATNLCWQQNMSSYLDYDGTTLNWTEAKTYCDNLDLGGHSDWYLPARQELFSITDLSRSNPAIVGGSTIFENIVNDAFWTVSTYGLSSGSNAWVVNFSDGRDNFF